MYDAISKKFLSFEKTVNDCTVKYNISKTHLKRVPKYNLTYQNKLFSNIPR